MFNAGTGKKKAALELDAGDFGTPVPPPAAGGAPEDDVQLSLGAGRRRKAAQLVDVPYWLHITHYTVRYLPRFGVVFTHSLTHSLTPNTRSLTHSRTQVHSLFLLIIMLLIIAIAMVETDAKDGGSDGAVNSILTAFNLNIDGAVTDGGCGGGSGGVSAATQRKMEQYSIAYARCVLSPAAGRSGTLFRGPLSPRDGGKRRRGAAHADGDCCADAVAHRTPAPSSRRSGTSPSSTRTLRTTL